MNALILVLLSVAWAQGVCLSDGQWLAGDVEAVGAHFEVQLDVGRARVPHTAIGVDCPKPFSDPMIDAFAVRELTLSSGEHLIGRVQADPANVLYWRLLDDQMVIIDDEAVFGLSDSPPDALQLQLLEARRRAGRHRERAINRTVVAGTSFVVVTGAAVSAIWLSGAQRTGAIDLRLNPRQPVGE